MRCIFFIFLWAGLAWYFPAKAQKIGKKELKRYVQELSSSEFEGRGTGEAGGEKAALYLEEKFRELNLQPLKGGDFLNPFSLFITYRERCTVKCGEKIYGDFEEMFCSSRRFTQNEEVEREMIFGGTGDTALLKEMDLQDKVIAFFVPRLRSTFSLTRFLAKRGAYAVFYANPDNELQFESMRQTLKNHLLAKRYSLDPEEKRLVIGTSDIYYAPVPEKETGEFYFRSGELAGMFGKSVKSLRKTTDIGTISAVRIKVLCKRIRKPVQVANVTAVVRGEPLTDRTLVVTAHYDHLGKQNGIIYPGADDNASGVAALLGVAADVIASGRKPVCNIVFAALVGEEKGLLGSSYFLDSTTVGLDIFGNVNIDMMGRIDGKLKKKHKQLYVFGDVEDVLFAGILKELSGKYALFPQFTQPVGFSSDHETFRVKGIPALFLYSGSHEDLHRPTDTWQRLDYDRLEFRTDFARELVRRLSGIPEN